MNRGKYFDRCLTMLKTDKSKSVKAIFIYGSESSYCSLSENDMVYRGLSHRSWDVSSWNIKNDAKSAEI